MSLILWSIPLGLLTGTLMGTFGGGGGVLLVPLLVYVFELSAHSATASSLIIVGTGAVAGLLLYARKGKVPWRAGLVLGVIGAPAASLGSFASDRVSERALLITFSCLLTVVAVMMFVNRQPHETEPRTTGVFALAAVGSGIGFLTGFFGVGGGFAIVPAMVLVFGYPMSQAAGASLLVILINSIVSLSSRAVTGLDVDWALVGVLSAATVLGNFLGSYVSSRFNSASLQKGFAVLLLGLAIFTAVSS